MDIPDPYMNALADQYEMKFRAVASQLTKLLTDSPEFFDEETYHKFQGVIEDELRDEQELFSFISFILAELFKAHHQLIQLGEAMATIQAVTINVMRPSETRDVMMAAVEEFRAQQEASDALFSDVPEQPQPRESFTTGTGQVLVDIHRADDCVGVCVIHRPVDGPWITWPTTWDEVANAMYRVCPHGTPHPTIEDWLRKPAAFGNHNCGCGCDCAPVVIERQMRKITGDQDGQNT